MTATALNGAGNLMRQDWFASRDEKGHRTYKLKLLVKVTDPQHDGPTTIFNATGIPLVGTPWAYGNNLDLWAFLKPTANIRRYGVSPGEPAEWWTWEGTWSTKQDDERCQNQTIENPLDEPMDISGSFVNYEKEAKKDKDDKAILTSSLEEIRGLMVTDHNSTVRIGQNVAALGLSTFSQMMNRVNDSPMWGLDARKVKLSNINWARKIYGTCNFYYTRTFEFDINFDGFDFDDVPDMGLKHLNGDFVTDSNGNVSWVYKTGLDITDPENFVQIKDKQFENITKPVMLDNGGKVADDPVNSPVFRPTIEYYKEANFFSLGIPTTL